MSFTDSFWTQDYNLGYRVLFDQLYEGIKENDGYNKIFEKRAELEMVYGNQLLLIKSNAINSKRLNDDDYISSIKNAYNKINDNFYNEGVYHINLSEEITAKILQPFSKWCIGHKERIEYSDSILSDKYKQFKAFKNNVDKIQKKYFNKCRILEDFKSHLDEDATAIDDANEEDDFDNKIYKLGDLALTESKLKSLLVDLIEGIEIKDHKVSILGTYNNVSNGSSIAHWLLKNVPEFQDNIDKVEQFGQDLITNEFIRLIGTINNSKSFINSSQFYYQWKPKTFELVGSQIGRSLSVQSKTQIADYFEDMKQVMGVNSVDFNDKSQYAKINQEVNQLDQHYYQLVTELDNLRCEFEELIMDHLSFMEKCEFDRLKAIKKVLFDFLKIFAVYAKDNQTFLTELNILEETINPVNDLKFFIENFKIGKFKPNVILYDNYYNSNINQTFGVDLTIKSRLDKKVVPILIQSILSHLDTVYPDLVNDEERVNLWVKPIALNEIHGLRFKLNQLTSSEDITGILKDQHPLIITNVLKLYLLELPDSLILNSYFEIIKSLYLNYPINTGKESIDLQRINGLQNVLVELPKCNLATLDAILTHLNRLVLIIGKKNTELANNFKLKLSKELSSIVILPKNNDHHIGDNFQFNLLVDLFNNKDTIFSELRRNNSSHDSKHSSIKSKKRKPRQVESSAVDIDGHTVNLDDSIGVITSEVDQVSISEVESTPSKSFDSTDEKENKKLPVTPNPKAIDKDPVTPKNNTTPGLRRSTSPNKKALNTYLGKGSQPKVISSKPSKKDIDVSEYAQPKFAATLGRRPSVKDLASKFDSSPSPTPKSSSSSTKSS